MTVPKKKSDAIEIREDPRNGRCWWVTLSERKEKPPNAGFAVGEIKNVRPVMSWADSLDRVRNSG